MRREEALAHGQGGVCRSWTADGSPSARKKTEGARGNAAASRSGLSYVALGGHPPAASRAQSATPEGAPLANLAWLRLRCDVLVAAPDWQQAGP